MAFNPPEESVKAGLLTCLLLFFLNDATAQSAKRTIALSLPYAKQANVHQEVFVNVPGAEIATVAVKCFDLKQPGDSVGVYAIVARKLKSKRKDISYFDIVLNNNGEKTASFNALYKSIVLKNNALPCGSYHTHVSIVFKDGDTLTQSFIQRVDSSLSISSDARKAFNEIYNPRSRKMLSGGLGSRAKAPTKFTNARLIIKKASAKVRKSFGSKGFVVAYRETLDKIYADVSYQGRYVGYYEMKANESLADKIEKERKQLSDNLTSGVSSGLEDNQTVFSQMKQLYSGKGKDEVIGNLSLRANAANAQEEYSEGENNFYEVAGQVEMPVMNIPVSLEGYYTSQDAGRVAKASYFRLHYDAEEAKAKLMGLIAGYNSKYDEALAKGQGLQGIYGAYLNKIQQDKEKLWREIAAETDISDIKKFQVDTSGLQQEIIRASEKKTGNTAGDLKSKREEALKQYNNAMDKYKKIEELEQKSEHYTKLLEQYKNNNYFDSIIAFDKLKNINSSELGEKSYKQLAKSAGSFLPEGESRKFISGLTNLDAGIFSKQVSSYTLNGQAIKGIDAGYDLGFCETGFTCGRVEYVDRDGQLDKYTGYSGRATFKPAARQKTALVYYGYMPSRRMLSEKNAFFDKVDAYMPTFRSPIHIVSVAHTAEVSKYAVVEVEGATSFRNRQEFFEQGLKLSDKMAYRIAAEGSIPKTMIDLKGEHEHVGQSFENNTLPLALSGIERYSAGAKGTFFKNFLSLAVEYNYLLQQNFASESANSKWGFEIRTTSKRYPSASISYKPFSTFRSVTDTLGIPQRPILGEVWLGRLSYQWKKKYYTLRVNATYNKNTAIADTVESGSNIAQLNAIYTTAKINLMLNAGQTQMKAGALSPVHGKTNFLTAMAGYMINSKWTVNAGQDVGTMKGRLSRYAMSIGGGYKFDKVPLSLQAGFRYNTYRSSESQIWKHIYSGMLDMSWRFRFKTNNRMS